MLHLREATPSFFMIQLRWTALHPVLIYQGPLLETFSDNTNFQRKH